MEKFIEKIIISKDVKLGFYKVSIPVVKPGKLTKITRRILEKTYPMELNLIFRLGLH